MSVPASVQAQLIGKVAEYDRGFESRVNAKVVIAIVTKMSDVDSQRATLQILAALRNVGPIAGLPHEEIVLEWADARTLAAACAQYKVGILYLTTGLGAEVGEIARSLDDSKIISVACVLSYVEKGAVLGFDLVSGHPKLTINLTSARRQGVTFEVSLLRLATVVR